GVHHRDVGGGEIAGGLEPGMPEEAEHGLRVDEVLGAAERDQRDPGPGRRWRPPDRFGDRRLDRNRYRHEGPRSTTDAPERAGTCKDGRPFRTAAANLTRSAQHAHEKSKA